MMRGTLTYIIKELAVATFSGILKQAKVSAEGFLEHM